MQFYSTKNSQTVCDLKTALLSGLASDGGLLLPEKIPLVDAATQTQWRALDFPALAAEIAITWFGDDVPPEILRTMTHEAYDFSPVLRSLGAHHSCELFHGPSASFKDFAAQLLMRLLDYFLLRDGERALILTATSGDTGSAVAAACAGRSALTAVILYPRGKISRVQEQQITMWPPDGNVHAVAVDGTFDDCQRLVKSLLADTSWCAQRLTSANSINVGRLLPQTFYYWWALLQFARRALPDARPVIVVPSGNFGNLTAGILAQRMGAPIGHFLAATNVNDAVPRYLIDGRYDPHPTIATISNAMDVGDPSNFERLRALFENNVEAMRAQISAMVVSDDATRATMRAVYDQHKIFLDPHTAVAWHALTQYATQHPATHGIVLATADAAKFPEVVHAATGQDPPVPNALADCASRRQFHETLSAPALAALQRLITGWVG